MGFAVEAPFSGIYFIRLITEFFKMQSSFTGLNQFPNFLFHFKMGSNDSVEGAVLVGRDAPPSHYLCTIQSFSALSKAQIKAYTSDKFEAGGFKWRLSINTAGGKGINRKDYISVSLKMVDTISLGAGWEVNVVFNFFIFNQLQDKYFGLRDMTCRHYHARKTEWEHNKFIDKESFLNPLNGYLIDDMCVFGVEILIVKNSLKGECLYLRNEPATYRRTWKVCKFSTLAKE